MANDRDKLLIDFGTFKTHCLTNNHRTEEWLNLIFCPYRLDAMSYTMDKTGSLPLIQLSDYELTKKVHYTC